MIRGILLFGDIENSPAKDIFLDSTRWRHPVIMLAKLHVGMIIHSTQRCITPPQALRAVVCFNLIQEPVMCIFCGVSFTASGYWQRVLWGSALYLKNN